MPQGFRLFPERASTMAGQVDLLLFALVGLSTLITLGIFAAIIYFAVKYRRGSNVDRSNPVTTSNRLEFTWAIIPLVLAMGVFAWSANLYFNIHRPPDDALEIFVVGKQWMWKIQHPGGQGEIDELHIPAGRPIKLTMTSQDVIHSFFIPAFRVKQDVLPGRYTTEWFEATKPGVYHLFCAEYCGTGHAEMTGQVVVMDPADYAQWLSGVATTVEATPESMAAAGERLFMQEGCQGCHRADGTGVGPPLQGVFGSQVQLESGQTVTADENYIRESILNPTAKVVAGRQPVMPSFQGRLTEEQLMQLIAYIKSLGSQKGSQ